MNKDKRVGWFAELKEGDEVIVESRYWKEIGVIKNITPTGKINVSYGNGTYQFDPSGSRKIDSWSCISITQISVAEYKEKEKYNNKLKKLSKVNWSIIGKEKVETVFELLFGEQND